jgi:glycyl-tRNA synthetase beta chain
MNWDAWLDDGKGDLTFGRPIRWLLFLYGGRVVPFDIRRTEAAQAPLVQEVRSGAMTYGHRFLTTSGRAGRAVKVKTFDDYKARLMEHFVVLEREERRERIARELDVHAGRLSGRVHRAAATQTGLLDEVPDLVEWPSVVPGIFPSEFLALPEEVLTTTMIHHQHYFPVVDDHGKLKPAFLAVTNVEVERPELISRNSERVLTARLRDAQFFWNADRRVPLADRIERLDTILFHKKLGSYKAKADRIEQLASLVAREALGVPGAVTSAALAGRLAKADLATDMVREFTNLQGTMGIPPRSGRRSTTTTCRWLWMQMRRRRERSWAKRPSRGPPSRSPTNWTRWSDCSPRVNGPPVRAIPLDCAVRLMGCSRCSPICPS